MTGREYLLIVGVLLLIICVCLLLLGMGYLSRRRRPERVRPERVEPCDLALARQQHIAALRDRHGEEAELGRVA